MLKLRNRRNFKQLSNIYITGRNIVIVKKRNTHFIIPVILYWYLLIEGEECYVQEHIVLFPHSEVGDSFRYANINGKTSEALLAIIVLLCLMNNQQETNNLSLVIL